MMKWFGLVLMAGLAGCTTQPSQPAVGSTVIPNVGDVRNTRKIDYEGAARERVRLAMNYLSKGINDKAKENLEKAESLAKLPEVYYYFGYYYEKVGEPDLAETYYKKATSGGKDADAYNFYGAFLCKNRRYDEADKAFMKAVAIPSYIKVAETYENAGLCAVENKKPEQAESYFTKALAHDARRVSSTYELAKLQFARKDCTATLASLKLLRQLVGNTPQGLLLAYQCEQQQGNEVLARSYRDLLKNRFPDSAEYRSLTEAP